MLGGRSVPKHGISGELNAVTWRSLRTCSRKNVWCEIACSTGTWCFCCVSIDPQYENVLCIHGVSVLFRDGNG
jgi:hypothetical protein